MSNFLIYCRKSSEQEDRQVLSNESQVSELKALANKLGIRKFEVLTESKSAKVEGRPTFNSMIEKIERGEIDSILVWHPDRLSRNPYDSARIIRLFDSGHLIEVSTPSQKFTNTPTDKFMLAFLMLQAKLENDNKGVNVKRGLKTKAENGWLPSGAKPGYMNDKYAEKGNKTILKDPDRFPLIRKCWELMLTGTYTVAQILRILNGEWGYRTPKHKRIGGKPMSRSMLYLVFADPFYYGEFEYPVGSGNWHKGKHESMITKDEFDRIQALLGRKGRQKPKTHQFAYTGLLTCGECGALITAEEKWQIICPHCKLKFASQNKNSCPNCQILIEEMANPTILHYIYYHCTKRKYPNCTQRSVDVGDFEKQVDDLLSKIQISERFKNWAIKYLNEISDREVDDRNSVLSSLQDAYNDCVKRIDNLVKLKISPQNTDGSLFSDDEFKSQKQSLLKEKIDLEEKLNDTGARISKWVELSEKSFEFACYAKYWFANGDMQKKREIFFGLGSNLKLFDKIVRLDLDRPLEYIGQAKNDVPEISPTFEPKEKSLTETQMETFYSQNPTLLRG